MGKVTIVYAVIMINHRVNIGCEKEKKDTCMTTVECKQIATSNKGYTCSEELCEGNDCVCSYYEQALCEDIGCEKEKKGTCMTKVECKQIATSNKGYTCSEKLCEGNDCVCGYYEKISDVKIKKVNA